MAKFSRSHCHQQNAPKATPKNRHNPAVQVWHLALSALSPGHLDSSRAGSSVARSMTPTDAGPQPKHAWKENRAFRFLASLQLAVVLLAVLAAASIAGTIAESKFDADTARTWIYEAPWFNLWLALLAANLACSALARWPWTRRHTGFLLTHLGIIVILAGAVIGQIWGVEGTMTLFKNAPPDNALVMAERVLTIRDNDAQRGVMIRFGRRPLEVGRRPLELWTTPGGWKIEATGNSSRLLAAFVPSAAPGGAPAVRVRLRTGAMNQTVDQWLLAGDRDRSRLDLGIVTVDLMAGADEPPPSGAQNRAVVRADADGSLGVTVFKGGQPAATAPLQLGEAVATGWNDWTITAVETLASAAPGFRFEPWPDAKPPPPGQRLLDGVKIKVSRGEAASEQWVAAGWRASFSAGPLPLDVSYGWEIYRLPFGLALTDFSVEHNEGTDEPAGFRSDLAVVLPDGTTAATASCSMNRPSNYPDAWWRSLTGLTFKISQASWNPNDLGQSSVQILRDPGWLAKWAGSLILCAGLVMMFLTRHPSTEPTSTTDTRHA